MLDMCACNIVSELKECLNHSPLLTPSGQKSDHAFLTYRFALSHRHEFRWVMRKNRKITEASEAAFSAELEKLEWGTTVEGSGLDAAAEAFHRTLIEMTDRHFLVTWSKVRSSDDPWIDDATRAMIRKRQRLFERTQKRCCKWKN